MLIPMSMPWISSTDREAVNKVMNSGWISSLSPEVEILEQEFSDVVSARHSVAVSNGTVALHLTLAALGIGEGDEVIVPNLSFVASISVIKAVGASPVIVDINTKDLGLNPNLVKKSISNNTRAIIAVHLFGMVADIAALKEIATEHNLHLIEDCAEALGAKYDNIPVGAFGIASTYSFYANKLITCGEGGMITTNDTVFYNRLIKLRDHAMSKTKRYYHDEVGYNFRLTGMQAALLRSQLSRIKLIIERRNKILGWYQRYLRKDIQVLTQNNRRTSINWFTTVQFKREHHAKNAMEILKLAGIDFRTCFYPFHVMPPYKNCRNLLDDTATKISSKTISLPTFHQIKKQQVEQVCNEINKYS